MQITASESEEKGARQLTVDYDLGEKLADSVRLFGEELVHSYFTSATRISLQGLMRRMMKAGKKDGEIKEAIAAWKPGVKKKGKSALEKALDLWEKMSPEEQAALRKKQAGK